MDEFVIDADDGYIPVQLDPVTVRIGGTLYQAQCPPDKKWHLFTNMKEGGASGDADALVEFLKASLNDEAGEEVLARMRDPEDEDVSLMKLMYVFGKVMDHYEPMIREHFQAMGMQSPLDQGAPANRAERRAVQKSNGRMGTKGARTPKGQTGARTGR